MRQKVKGAFSRWLTIVIVGTIIVFLASGVWFFKDQKRLQRAAVAANLRSIANLKAKQIVDWRTERLVDGAILMGRLDLIESVQRYCSNPTEQEGAEILRRLRPVKENYHFANILVINPQKQVVLSLGSEVGLCPEQTSAMEMAIKRQQPIWTPLYVAHDPPVPHISIIAPLLLETGDHRTVGALVLVCNAAEFLYPLIQSWPTPSATSETLLIRKDGNDVLFLNDLRHRKDTALKLRIPLSRADLPAAKALAGFKGIVEGKDYRGVKVIADILPVPDSPWYMVSKVDTAEAFAEWRFRSIMILVFLLGGIGFISGAGLVVWQRNLKSYYRELYQAETILNKALKRHKITLHAIGDAVISTDAKGRVELMNEVAENLTGWTLETARGKDLSEVFHIINEHTRNPMKDPIKTVLKKGKVVGIANHTLLINRDGREIPIADSGSPIKDENNEILGVVLVFKDQTSDRQYQKTILESEEKYRLLADNTLDLIWTMNMDLTFTYVNPAIKRLTGHEPDEWIGTRLPEHCDEELFSEIAEVIAKEIAKGPSHRGFVLETELLKKSNTPIFVELHGRINFDENGNPAGIQGTIRDISERRQTNEALVNSEDKFKSIFNNVSDGIVLADIETKKFYISNKVFCDMFGYSIEEIRSLGVEDIHPQEALPHVMNEFELQVRGKKALADNMPCLRKGGTIFYADINTASIKIDERKYIIGCFRDITERKQAEEVLVKSKEKLTSLVDKLIDSLIVTDRDGTIKFVNKAACTLFGRERDNFIGTLFGFPVSLDKIFEIASIQLNGKINYAEARAVMSDWDGETSYIISLRDITERKTALDEREKMNLHLQQVEKIESIGNLAGGIAHDFNNMLSVIIGYGEDILTNLHKTDPLRESAKEIVEAGRRSASLTRQLLAFSRRQTLQPEVLDLNVVVRNIESMLRRLIGEDMELTALLAEDLARVKIDPGQFEQVIINLVINARDAMPQGGKLTIETANMELDEKYVDTHVSITPGDYVILSITDSGCGMDEETRMKVFEPFFTTKEKGKGTGLGLSTVYGIVKQSGGYIWVYSEIGRGTTFKIYLPQTTTELSIKKATKGDNSIQGKGEMVLVVEDEPSLRKLCERILKLLNYNVTVAANGGEALLLVEERKFSPDLIITDVVMPEMSGKVLVDRLKKNLPDLKFLYMSGYTDDAIIHHGVLESGTPFIQKPFTKNKLGKAVRSVLDEA